MLVPRPAFYKSLKEDLGSQIVQVHCIVFSERLGPGEPTLCERRLLG
jgi:hypothetical protein